MTSITIFSLEVKMLSFIAIKHLSSLSYRLIDSYFLLVLFKGYFISDKLGCCGFYKKKQFVYISEWEAFEYNQFYNEKNSMLQ